MDERGPGGRAARTANRLGSDLRKAALSNALRMSGGKGGVCVKAHASASAFACTRYVYMRPSITSGHALGTRLVGHFHHVWLDFGQIFRCGDLVTAWRVHVVGVHARL